MSIFTPFPLTFIIYFLTFFSFIPYLFCQTTQNQTVASRVLFGTMYLPGNDCNQQFDTNFTGKEWYIIKYAYDYVDDEKYSIECYSDQHQEYLPSMLIAAYSYIIIVEDLNFWKVSQPTVQSGLSIIKKYSRPPWLFFQNLSRVAFFLVFIIFPLMAGISIWIIEEKAFSLDVYLIEMIITYFFYSETRISQTPGRIICWLMHVIALVFITMYTGSLIERYQNYKSFDGLTEPGGLYNKKIPSQYPPAYIEPYFSMIAFPEVVIYHTKDLEDIFSSGNVTSLLGDSDVVENFAEATCDVYTVISNWKAISFSCSFGKNTTNSQQQIWNEAITKATENLSPQEIDLLYDQDPLAVKVIPCKGKYRVNLNTYILTDFYELWIIYASAVVTAIIFKIISHIKDKISLKYDKYIRINIIRGWAEKSFCSKTKKMVITYLLINLISITAQLDNQKNKIKQHKKYRCIKNAKSMDAKIKKSFATSLKNFAKKKFKLLSIWRMLLHNKSFKKKRIGILKQMKKTICKIRQPFYLQNPKKKLLILSLGFDHFLRQLFIANLTSQRLKFIKKIDTGSQFIIASLPYYWGTSFSLKDNEFTNISHCSSTIFSQYFDPFYLKLKVLNKSDKDIIQQRIDKLIMDKIMQAKTFKPFEVAAKIRKIILTKIRNKSKKNFIEKFPKDVVEQIDQKSYFLNKPFLDLDPAQKKAIYNLTRKIDLTGLKVTHAVNKFVIKLSNNYGELVYKKPKRNAIQDVYVGEPHSNFIENMEYQEQNIKQ